MTDNYKTIINQPLSLLITSFSLLSHEYTIGTPFIGQSLYHRVLNVKMSTFSSLIINQYHSSIFWWIQAIKMQLLWFSLFPFRLGFANKTFNFLVNELGKSVTTATTKFSKYSIHWAKLVNRKYERFTLDSTFPL